MMTASNSTPVMAIHKVGFPEDVAGEECNWFYEWLPFTLVF